MGILPVGMASCLLSIECYKAIFYFSPHTQEHVSAWHQDNPVESELTRLLFFGPQHFRVKQRRVKRKSRQFGSVRKGVAARGAAQAAGPHLRLKKIAKSAGEWLELAKDEAHLPKSRNQGHRRVARWQCLRT